MDRQIQDGLFLRFGSCSFLEAAGRIARGQGTCLAEAGHLSTKAWGASHACSPKSESACVIASRLLQRRRIHEIPQAAFEFVLQLCFTAWLCDALLGGSLPKDQWHLPQNMILPASLLWDSALTCRTWQRIKIDMAHVLILRYPSGSSCVPYP